MAQVQRRVMSFVKDTKCNCERVGPCYGYTDPCGQECFKFLGSRSAFSSRHPTLQRINTTSTDAGTYDDRVAQNGNGVRASSVCSETPVSPLYRTAHAESHDIGDDEDQEKEREKQRQKERLG